MGVFSKEQMNYALLGMYVGTRGPKTLRKCITDQLFIYQMCKNEETIRMNIDAEMVHLVFPAGESVPSLDDLDDLVLQDIGSLVFELSRNEQDISKIRNLIQDLLEGPIFHEYLQSRENRFRKKNSTKKLLSKTQFAKLYPESGDPCISDFDITVLCFILFEGMGFRPITDLNKFPLESYQMEADDMLRIKMCRNNLVHRPDAAVSDEDFDYYWECLTGAFERLLKSQSVRRDSDKLKSLRLPDEKIDHFQDIIQGWRIDDLDERRNHLKQIKDVVIQTGLHTESVIKAAGTHIVENQNEKHEELVSLLKQNNSKRQKVQNKEFKKSFPLRICGFDKFNQVCQFMHKNGIKYMLPTASSTDTSHHSDSSSSTKSSDPELIQCEKDKEDAIDEASLNLHQLSTRHGNDSNHEYQTSNEGINNIHVIDTTDSEPNGNRQVASARPKKHRKRHSKGSVRSSEEATCCTGSGNAERNSAKTQSTSKRSSTCSKDSSGYNNDLVTLINSVDGNKSCDTLLSKPVRPDDQFSSHRVMTQRSRTEGDRCFHHLPPKGPFNVTDDGYYSNGYISSLERGPSSTRNQFTGLPTSGNFSRAVSCVDGKANVPFNAYDDGYYSNGYMSSLDRGASSTRRQGSDLPTLQTSSRTGPNADGKANVLLNAYDDGHFSNGYMRSLDRGASSTRHQGTDLPTLQNLSRTCPCAEGKETEHDKELDIQISGKRLAEKSYMGPCLSTDASRQIQRIKLSENEHHDRHLPVENQTDSIRGTLV